MSNLTNDLAEAWFLKFRKAQEQLAHIEHAPAFFKPEYVEQVKKDKKTAARWVKFWNTHS